MVTLICDDCGRKVEAPEDYDPNATCRECGSYFSEQDSEEVEEEYEDTWTCENCNEDLTEDKLVFFGGENNKDDYNVVVCKKCLAKISNIEPQIIYKEKIVEKPVIRYIDNSGKEIQKQETNQIFNSVF